jgi:hypothetical protein
VIGACFCGSSDGNDRERYRRSLTSFNSEQMDIYVEHHSFEKPKPVYDDTFWVESMDDAVMLVYQNDGISFLPELRDFINSDKITFIPQTIESVPFIVNAYWIKDNQNPELKVFLKEIENRFSGK